jgi:hypothetical protein
MLRKLLLAGTASSFLLTGCADEGGGPLGIVLFDKTHHVAAAEPLFGKGEDRCLDSPGFLISITAKAPAATSAAQPRTRDPLADPACVRLSQTISGALQTPQNSATSSGYDERQRNEVIDALIAASNRKCGRYTAFLQTYDANINSTFGIGALATAGLATVVGGESASKALAAGSAFLTGTRSTFNEAHFRNRTIAVLATAFENARREQRQAITNFQQCKPAQYTMMRGIEDALRYHNTCSVVSGLDEAARAVQRANSPDLETMRKAMTEILAIRQQLAAAEAPPAAAPLVDGEEPAQPDGTGGEPNPPAVGAAGSTEPKAAPAAVPALIAGAQPVAPACPFNVSTAGAKASKS